MGSWDTTSGPTVSDSLRKRALKREVIQTRNKRWVVSGDPKLGDTYDEYILDFDTRTSRYTCECSSHYGGQYRKFCSHLLATIYHRQKNPDKVYDEPATIRAPAQIRGGSESPPHRDEAHPASVPPRPSPLRSLSFISPLSQHTSPRRS